VWELIFLMLVMKIPIAYLCWVVWWAIKSEPRPLEGAAQPAVLGPEPPPRPPYRFSRRRPRPRLSGPHGTPVRTAGPRAELARAKR
jgi:hypothetical protein